MQENKEGNGASLVSSTADCGASSALACSEPRNVKISKVRKVKG